MLIGTFQCAQYCIGFLNGDKILMLQQLLFMKCCNVAASLSVKMHFWQIALINHCYGAFSAGLFSWCFKDSCDTQLFVNLLFIFEDKMNMLKTLQEICLIKCCNLVVGGGSKLRIFSISNFEWESSLHEGKIRYKICGDRYIKGCQRVTVRAEF